MCWRCWDLAGCLTVSPPFQASGSRHRLVHRPGGTDSSCQIPHRDGQGRAGGGGAGKIDASNADWLRTTLLETAARGHATFVVDMTAPACAPLLALGPGAGAQTGPGSLDAGIASCAQISHSRAAPGSYQLAARRAKMPHTLVRICRILTTIMAGARSQVLACLAPVASTRHPAPARAGGHLSGLPQW
jgi:hypothetical protein